MTDVVYPSRKDYVSRESKKESQKGQGEVQNEQEIKAMCKGQTEQDQTQKGQINNQIEGSRFEKGQTEDQKKEEIKQAAASNKDLLQLIVSYNIEVLNSYTQVLLNQSNKDAIDSHCCDHTNSPSGGKGTTQNINYNIPNKEEQNQYDKLPTQDDNIYHKIEEHLKIENKANNNSVDIIISQTRLQLLLNLPYDEHTELLDCALIALGEEETSYPSFSPASITLSSSPPITTPTLEGLTPPTTTPTLEDNSMIMSLLTPPTHSSPLRRSQSPLCAKTL